MSKKTLEAIFVLPEGSPKTFSYDESLPSLPVPSLQHTLDRYVESVQPFVTASELAHTKRLVKEFERGIGIDLHAKLMKRAAAERNWLEKWWDSQAYLTNRQPLIPHCSMMGLNLLNDLEKSLAERNYIKEASCYMHNLVSFWLLLRKEQMKPTTGNDGTHFSMMQFRRLFNTVRLPGETEDHLVSYFKTESEGPCPSHLIVMCKGRLFRVDGLDATGAPISAGDWAAKLEAVEETCRRYDGPGVGILTCDDRTIWAKNRQHLESLSFENRATLHEIDSAIGVLVLDDDEPTTNSEIGFKSLTGNFKNRWADKSIATFCFKNGAIGGLCEHSAFDGLISLTAMNYVFIASKDMVYSKDLKTPSSLPMEISFHIDQHIRNEVQAATIRLEENKKLVVVSSEAFTDYGKQLIQAHRLHPDAFCQMALQLGYYRLHHKLAPTYETATTRAFYNGRTETVRTCTKETKAWLQAMIHPKASDKVRLELLKKAISKHDKLMKEARDNEGCDRHLFGMYCIAAEEGLKIPELYTDPAYAKSGGGGNFVLSTSLTGYSPIGGGVAPMVLDGYGVFYCINPGWIRFSVIVWRDSLETSACKFNASVGSSLRDMMALLGPAPVSAKL